MSRETCSDLVCTKIQVFDKKFDINWVEMGKIVQNGVKTKNVTLEAYGDG